VRAIHLPGHDTRSPSGADQKFYRLEPPFQYQEWSGAKTETYEWVCVSAVSLGRYTGSRDGFVLASIIDPITADGETYIFPADVTADGGAEVTSWGELPGSFKGDLDHDRALRNMGYEPVYEAVEAAK
jgi:hypothetical protein